MATVTSGAGMSALLQKASQQYLECRRKVTAKTEEVKDLETQIQWIFARINESSAATKSVGRLELKIVAIEGEAPVDDAVVSVEIDPEYEEPAPAAKAAEEAEDKADDESPKEENAEEEEKKAEEEEEKTEEKEPVVDEAPKEKARRSVLWKDAEGLPLEVVFDPVQSREAVVTIAIAPPATDGEESEPVKEFRIPVSSLFQTGSINRWYVLKKVEHVHVDKAAVTEVADQDEATKEKTEEAEEKPTEEAEKPTEDAENKPAEEAAEEKAADEVEDKAAEPTEDTPNAETAEPVAEDTEKKGDAESPTHLVAAEASVESEDKVVVVQEGKLHVQIHFTMSEIEKLSQTAITLSQQKQEAEAVLAVLDREAASLRVKYERLSASQRSLSASGGVVKPRSTLLGGRGLGAAPVRAEKSTYQKVKDSVAAVFTPQRTQVLTSFAIFCGSVALFHFQGDNLLA